MAEVIRHTRNRPKIPLEERFVPEPNTGCWLWLGGLTGSGYGIVRAPKMGKNKGAHRAVYEWLRGPLSENALLCHKCDVRSCVNPDHMFVGSHTDNQHDAYDKGRHSVFRHVGKPKLMQADVAEIRRRLVARDTQSAIAKDFGVSLFTVCAINTGRTWKA